MLRLIGYVILTVIVLSILRAVIGIVGKMFSSYALGDKSSPNRSGRPRSSQVPSGGVLHKDPSCGTYISESLALKHSSGGETLYFCSEDCRRKYLTGA